MLIVAPKPLDPDDIVIPSFFGIGGDILGFAGVDLLELALICFFISCLFGLLTGFDTVDFLGLTCCLNTLFDIVAILFDLLLLLLLRLVLLLDLYLPLGGMLVLLS